MHEHETLLSAYADGELDDEAANDVERLLAEDAAARDRLAMHLETTGLLRAALAAGNYAYTIDRPPVRRRHRAIPRSFWAMAASVLLVVAGFGAGQTSPNLFTSGRAGMLTEIAEYHSIYSRETVHLVEVPAAQVDHLKIWLGNRVGRDLVVPDFKEAGLTFAGGRLIVLNGTPVAELMYTRDNGLPIAFCILDRGSRQRAVEVEQRGNVNLADWSDASHSYVIVGEANPETIRGLAERARQQI